MLQTSRESLSIDKTFTFPPHRPSCQLARAAVNGGSDSDLMGTAEVAALLQVSRQRVLQLAQRDDFPKPLAVLKMGKVWRAADIRRWAAAR